MSADKPQSFLAGQFTDTQALYRELIQHTLDVVTILDESGVIAYQSDSMQRVLGFAPRETLGLSAISFIHPEDREPTIAAINRVVSGEREIESHEFRFTHKAGGYRHMHAVAQRWDSGGVRGLVVNSRDVTDYREAQMELQRSQELLQKTFLASRNLLSISLPGTGEFLEVNDAWCETLGHSREEAIGATALSLGIWGSRENREVVIGDLLRNGGLKNYEAEAFNSRGEPIRLLIDAQILQIHDEPRILLSCQDITATRQVEEELRQAYKMDAVGQLTGGVAHDFNNLLGVILGCAELLMPMVEEQPRVTRLLSQIMEAGNRGASLTQQLLAFSRRQNLQPEIVELRTLLDDINSMLHASLPDNVQLEIVAGSEALQVNVDPRQLETAVLNLVLNARDALPNGGTVTISLSADTGPDTAVAERAILTVRDNGDGIAAEILPHVFEPFFTTKETGKGTGLGLSMVFGFVQQSGGSVEIDSTPGQGTGVHIRLPRCEAPDNQDDVAESADVDLDEQNWPGGQGERLLLIEDNEALRDLVNLMLDRLGYNVVAVAGEEQLANADYERGTIDLIICDVVLAGSRRGPEVVKHWFDDNARVLFITGYADADIPVGANHALLHKPFTMTTLADAVHASLSVKA